MTNIRNTGSSFWRAWMKPEHRVLVPVSSFCEYLPGRPAVPHWFALGEECPLFAFAGLWRPWTGTRAKTEGEHELFAFLIRGRPNIRAVGRKVRSAAEPALHPGHVGLPSTR